MPKKSKRIASRQAELSGRSRRTRTHGPTGIPVASSTPPEQQASQATAGEQPQPSTPTPARELAWRQARPSAAAATPRSRARSTLQIKPAETYFGPEMRRIGLTVCVVLAVLAILVFVMP